MMRKVRKLMMVILMSMICMAAMEREATAEETYCVMCGGIGTCDLCLGSGQGNCDNCFGSGICSNCDGQGGEYRYVVGGDNRWLTCTYCDGSIQCSRCHGSGTTTCYSCYGLGNCSVCCGRGVVSKSDSSAKPESTQEPKQTSETELMAALGSLDILKEKKPFDGSLFSDFGECLLYSVHFDLDGKGKVYYDVYVFTGGDQDKIKEIAAVHEKEHNFAAATGEIDGLTAYCLTQSGEDGKSVIIVPEFSDGMLVLLQEGIEVTGDVFPCSACGDTKICSECSGHGKICSSCENTGNRKCYSCSGKEYCRLCDGNGIAYMLETHVVWCYHCSGSGVCGQCDGEGTVECVICKGMPDSCEKCSGTGVCSECN